MASKFAACAVENTVLAAVANGKYGARLTRYAELAAKVGFACVAAQAMDAEVAALTSPALRVLPPPPQPLLPEPQYCNARWAKHGWRSAQLHKMLLWRIVLAAGYDLLALDLDWRLDASPVPQLHALREVVGKDRQGRRADVIAMYDGPRYKVLNIGTIWLRNTPDVRALVEVVANRTLLGWDQLIFSEELNFNSAFSSIPCCHTRCFRAVATKLPEINTADRRAQAHEAMGQAVGAARPAAARHGPACEARAPHSALGPPTGTRFKWSHYGGWSESRFNMMSENHVRFGRCTLSSGVCAGEAVHAGWANCSSREGGLVK